MGCSERKHILLNHLKTASTVLIRLHFINGTSSPMQVHNQQLPAGLRVIIELNHELVLLWIY